MESLSVNDKQKICTWTVRTNDNNTSLRVHIGQYHVERLIITLVL